MEAPNDTRPEYFILLGLFNYTQAHSFLFSVVMVIFPASLMGNALMILLIHRDPRLHTPMYFLLSQLSLMDMMLASTIIPKMASNYLMHKRTISPAGCGSQIFLFLTLAGRECFLLAAMSYDRYAAVCQPLRYHGLVSRTLCWHLTLGSWLLGAADGLLQAGTVLSYPFCGSREINHFFCEAPSLVRLACADTQLFEFFMYVCCLLMLLIPLSLVLLSYTLILLAVLRLRSTAARKKAFATCSSHLAVVGLFYGAIMFIYMRPKSRQAGDGDKVVSAFYSIFTPVLNPLIYSVRNKEVKGALREWLLRTPWVTPMPGHLSKPTPQVRQSSHSPSTFICSTELARVLDSFVLLSFLLTDMCEHVSAGVPGTWRRQSPRSWPCRW